MKFKLEIDCDNDAFEGGCSLEISRILADLADTLACDEMQIVGCIKLRDGNGNTVGTARLMV